jgi:hypothetical protein
MREMLKRRQKTDDRRPILKTEDGKRKENIFDILAIE